jgi:hypothetical protein
LFIVFERSEFVSDDLALSFPVVDVYVELEDFKSGCVNDGEEVGPFC